MISTICVNFFLKKTKVLANGTAPIYLRLTIAGRRTEFTTRRYVKPERWNPLAKRMTGTNEEAREFNHYIKTFEQEIFATHRLMMANNEEVSIETVKNRLHGKTGKTGTKMIVAIFQEHNNRIRSLLGKEFSAGTLTRYETSLKHTIDFMEWKYNISDIEIHDIDHEFISSYDFYLRSERSCSNNTTVKYIKNFKKIIRICIANGWLDRDPFANYKIKLKEVNRDYLISEEIATITAKQFSSERINRVRDIFLFSCYTGLSYADVKKLKRSEIVLGIDKQYWLSTSRQKTGTASRIPLLPEAWRILEKYKNDPETLSRDQVLPIVSNQKMNSYLKEIADVCGINKKLTFHIARHSFATSITLANGVSIESVSKMLGHKNIRTTQHYAKILDAKVSKDMTILRHKLLKSE